MRVFVTGASGHIGSLVTAELTAAGHRVVGLARSPEGEARVSAAGGEPLRGNLDDVEPLAEAAAASEGVIHLAFRHDAGFGTTEASDTDLRVIRALGGALAGTGKPLVVTSGTMMIAGAGDPATEEVLPSPDRAAVPRVGSELEVLDLAQRGVRASIVRLAPTVHGPTDRHGFVPSLIEFARQAGAAAYIDGGANRWPAVHNLDAAHLFRLAVEDAPAGSVLHGVAEGGIPFREIATAIGRGLGLPVRSVTLDEAPHFMQHLAQFAVLDDPVSSTLTQELVGWLPTHPGLLADLDDGFYFQRSAAVPGV